MDELKINSGQQESLDNNPELVPIAQTGDGTLICKWVTPGGSDTTKLFVVAPFGGVYTIQVWALSQFERQLNPITNMEKAVEKATKKIKEYDDIDLDSQVFYWEGRKDQAEECLRLLKIKRGDIDV